MSDLIDRQRALDAFDYWVKSPMVGYSNGLVRLHEMLEEIPPAKQEPCTDAISRELALEKMADYVASGYADSAEDFEEYSKIICQLPPVTPVKKQEPCEDAISRQAVLEIIRKCHCEEWVKADIGAPIEALQSVNPAENVGHWIDHQEDRWIYAKCSECETVHDTRTNYCPNCGSRMMQEVEE